MRSLTAEEKRWQAAVHSLECCVLCKRYGVQWSHRDEDKGMGIKTDPWMTAALCPDCHYEAGMGKHLTKEERRAMMDRAIVRTHAMLIERGLLVLVPK